MDDVSSRERVDIDNSAPRPGWRLMKDPDALDIAGLFRKFWRRKGLIVGITLIGTLLPIIYVMDATPLYTGTSKVLIETRRTNVVGFQDVLGGISRDLPALQSEIIIIKSRELAAKVVDRAKLLNDPEFNPPPAPDTSVWQIINPLRLVSSGWLSSLFSSPTSEVALEPPSPEQQRAQMRERAANRLLSRLEVAFESRSMVLNISVTSESAQKSAMLANTVAEVYQTDQLEAKLEATRRANQWLQQQVEEVRARVETAERAVAEYRDQAGLTRAGSGTVSGQQLTELNTQLVLARAARAEAEARLSQIEQVVASGNVQTVTEVLTNPMIQNLRSEEVRLLQRRAELSETYGPRHPRIINTNAEIESLHAKMEVEIRRVMDNLRLEVTATRSRENALRDSLGQLERRAGVAEQQAVQLATLEREAAAERDLFSTLQSRLKETSQQDELNRPDVRIISRAITPGGPSFPRSGLIIAAGFVVSFMFGIGGAFLIEQFDRGFRSGDQIEAMLGIGTLGLIPLLPRRSRRGRRLETHVVDRPHSAFAEAFRTLYTAILLSNVDKPPKIILITSSVPSEGKTTTVVSLGRQLAKNGKKVLLADADLRYPRVHEALGIKRGQGLVDVLADQSSLENTIIVDEISGLHVLTAGTTAPNPPDLLSSEHMRRFLAENREAYDVVLLDSPPVLAVSDAWLLARLVDTVVYVIRWGETPREIVDNGLKRLREDAQCTPAALLTMVNTRTHAKYGYGDSGYYYGKYGKYYHE